MACLHTACGWSDPLQCNLWIFLGGGMVSPCPVVEPWAVPAAGLVWEPLPTWAVREKARDCRGDVAQSCLLLGGDRKEENTRGWGAEEERLSIFLFISLNATRQKGKVIVTGHSSVFSQSRIWMIVSLVQRLFCLVFSRCVELSRVCEASPKPIERNTCGHKGKSKS